MGISLVINVMEVALVMILGLLRGNALNAMVKASWNVQIAKAKV